MMGVIVIYIAGHGGVQIQVSLHLKIMYFPPFLLKHIHIKLIPNLFSRQHKLFSSIMNSTPYCLS